MHAWTDRNADNATLPIFPRNTFQFWLTRQGNGLDLLYFSLFHCLFLFQFFKCLLSLLSQALPCPENSHFDECTNACPLTCSNLDEPEEPCPLPCQEGCQCEDGFALRDGLCVARSDCGCMSHGRQLATNQTFWTDWECQERCYCNGTDNSIYCHLAPCHPEEYCQENDGLYFCQPRTEALCVAAGYGHFLPFSGVPFELQSSCSLSMATTNCERGNSDHAILTETFPQFRLAANNEDRDTGQAIWVRGFVLEVYEYEIKVSRSYKNTVTVSEFTTINDNVLKLHSSYCDNFKRGIFISPNLYFWRGRENSSLISSNWI